MEQLGKKINGFVPLLNERLTRLYLGHEALMLGRGGIAAVSRLSGANKETIRAGIKEIKEMESQPLPVKDTGRVRKKGGGRKKAIAKQKKALPALLKLMDAHTRGDPMGPLLWSSKSLRKLEGELAKEGIRISYVTIGNILKENGFSLQANRKTDEGSSHIDRDAQFEHINETSISFMETGQPVISVDCKKKELMGNYKNAGREWHGKSSSPTVNVYDFPGKVEETIDPESGEKTKDMKKAVPYGIYDIQSNEGFVNVGINHDTAEFAVGSIGHWWERMGREKYPCAEKLLINADGGGSNSSRSRLWKIELQGLANKTGLEIEVCHFPPGTSKWNKIEHRLFSYISINWRGKPLTSYQTVVSLIKSTKTEEGLKVESEIDKKTYATGRKITDREFENLNITYNEKMSKWNYSIKPK